jgi:competence protein ComEC
MTLPLVAVAWLLSFAAVGVWGAEWWVAGVWFAAVVPAGVATRGVAAGRMLGVLAMVALLGGARYGMSLQGSPPALPATFGEEVVLAGTVSSEPDPGLTTVRYRVRIETLDGGLSPDEASVLIAVDQFLRLLPGDRVVVRGELELPPDDLGGFDYRAYLLSQGVVATMFRPEVESIDGGGIAPSRASTRLRLSIEEALQRALPEPEASLAAGIAVGRDDEMAPEVVSDFRSSGLAHLTAVSGSNVAILAAIVFTLCIPWLGRYRAILPAALVLTFYLAAAGFAPTIVRATIMAGVFLVGLWLGRPQSGLAGLGLAAIAMTAVKPAIARDVGFQLSLAATAGLIVFTPWLEAMAESALARAKLRGVAGSAPPQVFAITAAATVATLPIVAHTFGRVSIVGLGSNLVAAPLFVVAFPLSLLTAAAGLAWEPAGWLAGLATYYPLAAIVAVAERSAAVPGASVPTGEIGSSWALGWVAVLCLLGWLAYVNVPPQRRTVARSRGALLARRGLFAAACGSVATWVGLAGLSPLGGPGQLEVHVLDVGQGDAILIWTPDGDTVLVDGGPSGESVARELGEVLPHWERAIDIIVLTHPHEDHLAGLAEVQRRYRVGTVATNGETVESLAFDELMEAEEAVSLAAGESFEVDGVHFEVLWPSAGFEGSTNDASLVLRVTYGDAVLLLTGDVEAAAQAELLLSGTPLRAHMLKVPHHGGGTSQGAFLEAVGAEVVVISAGAENRFGHPADSVLAVLVGARVLRTDEDGRVTLRTDGTSWTYESER